MSNIIFDFDGTIADSLETILEVFYEIKHIDNKFSSEEINEFRGLSLVDIAEKLKISWWQMPFLLLRGRKLMADHMNDIRIFNGMDKVIKELHHKGHHLYIMSSNSAQNIDKFLMKHKLNSYFSHVKGGVGLFSKARALRSLLDEINLEASSCFYIGDEGRDIEASRSVGIRCIAVNWGLSTTELLKKMEPFAQIDKPDELLNVIKH